MRPLAAEAALGHADVLGGRRLLAGRYDERRADALTLVQPELGLRLGRLVQLRAVQRAVRARVRPLLRRVGRHAVVLYATTECRESRREVLRQLDGSSRALPFLRARRDDEGGKLLAVADARGRPSVYQRGRRGEPRAAGTRGCGGRRQRRRPGRADDAAGVSKSHVDRHEPRLAGCVALRLADTEHDSTVRHAAALTMLTCVHVRCLL